MHYTPTHHRGVTLLEIIAAIGIVAIISAVVLASFSQFRERKTLDATVETTLAAFSRAHLDTISSLNDKQYGVHLDAGQAVYFVGTTYTAGLSTNVVYKLNPAIEIANIALTGGGTDVIFQSLKGDTAQNGTFEIRVKGHPTLATVVTVNGTGAVAI